MPNWLYIAGNWLAMRRVRRTLDALLAALEKRDSFRAVDIIQASDELFTKSKFVRTALIELITIWRGLEMKSYKIGAAGAASLCAERADMLQARFDAGDYCPDSFVGA